MKFSRPALILTSATLLFLCTGWSWARVNLTASLPIGIYVRSSNGQYVEFCPEQPWGKISIERGYRPKVSWICQDGGQPLLKPVAAQAGDVVEVSEQGISVNGVLLRNSSPRRTDSAGRDMQAFPQGRYQVQHGTLWVVSTYHGNSFDSRYYGPIPVSSILGHRKPLLVGK